MVDTHRDGTMDYTLLDVQVPLQPSETVQSITCMIFFDYRLENRLHLNMDTMAYHTASTPLPGTFLPYPI